MLQSDYDDIGGQQFTVSVRKDGEEFVSSTKNAPELGEFRDRTQRGAMQKANDALAKFAANGYKVKK